MEEIILVLGMHRSGTSAATRLLNLFGAEVGNTLLQAQEGVNRKGFWEHAGFVKLNDQLFKELKSAWYDYRRFPDKWWQKKEIDDYRAKCLELFASDFELLSVVAIKDPRICRLLPFWLETIETYGQSPKCLLVLRHPLEVAQSLLKRDGFDPLFSVRLWLAYVLESEYYSRNYKRVIISYDEILNDWPEAISRITREFEIHWPLTATELESIIGQEIHPREKHFFADENKFSSEAIIRMALDVYQIFTLETDADPCVHLDSFRKRFFESQCVDGSLHDALFNAYKILVDRNLLLTKTGQRLSHAMSVVSQRDQQLNHLNLKLEKLRHELKSALENATDKNRRLTIYKKASAFLKNRLHRFRSN